MNSFSDPVTLQKWLISNVLQKGKSLGFVPTMGALHEGHLTLVRQSRAENDLTVVSIFINPTQFNSAEDFDLYPRQVEQDIRLLGDDPNLIVFTPTTDEMYPAGKENEVIRFHLGTIAQGMEGAYRPGHFEGVVKIVLKLLHVVQPSRAYFGLKDLQQYSIIKQMGKELFLASEIVGVPTKREASGLAMSSRNTRLSDQGKSHAAVLYKALSIVQEYYQAGEKPEDAVQKGKAILEQSEAKVEYLELVLLDSLSPVQIANEKQKKAVCVAAEIENVRLIDNLIFS